MRCWTICLLKVIYHHLWFRLCPQQWFKMFKHTHCRAEISSVLNKQSNNTGGNNITPTDMRLTVNIQQTRTDHATETPFILQLELGGCQHKCMTSVWPCSDCWLKYFFFMTYPDCIKVDFGKSGQQTPRLDVVWKCDSNQASTDASHGAGTLHTTNVYTLVSALHLWVEVSSTYKIK